MTDAQPRLLIKNGTLIDGSGCDPVPKTLVVVEGNRITHVGPADSPIRPESPDDTVIDATGKFILPGLIDVHCHISLHPASEGTPADTAGVLCNTRDEFIRETRKQCKRGVDLIKIADSSWGDVQTVADDEISAVVDEAHRHNVKVTIHSRGSTSTRAAANAGVDLIYHGDLATEDDLDIIAKAGMPIAPVLTSPWIGVEHGAAARGFGDRVRDRLRMQLDTSFQMIRNARARGIPILSGSDTGNASAFTHGRWHGKEAELFVKEVGMTPMEAILANTSGNAAMVNLAGEVGVIAPAKRADIVIWDSDPIADMTVLQRPEEISAIIKDGRIVDREGIAGFRELSEEPGRSRKFAYAS